MKDSIMAYSKSIYCKTSNNILPVIMSAPLIFDQLILDTFSNIRPLIMSSSKIVLLLTRLALLQFIILTLTIQFNIVSANISTKKGKNSYPRIFLKVLRYLKVLNYLNWLGLNLTKNKLCSEHKSRYIQKLYYCLPKKFRTNSMYNV